MVFGTTNTTEQALTANALVNLGNTNVPACPVEHASGSTAITLQHPGKYAIIVNADIEPAAAGDVTLQLLNNGVAVPGAEATVTGTVGDTYNVSFAGAVKILPSCQCVNNLTNLQVQISAEAVVSNISLVVVA